MQSKRSVWRHFIVAAGLLTAGSGALTAQTSPSHSAPFGDIRPVAVDSAPSVVFVKPIQPPVQNQPYVQSDDYGSVLAPNYVQGKDAKFWIDLARDTKKIPVPVDFTVVMLSGLIPMWILKKNRSSSKEGVKYSGKLSKALPIIAQWWPMRDDRSDMSKNIYLDLTEKEFGNRIVWPINNPVSTADEKFRSQPPEVQSAMVPRVESVGNDLVKSQRQLEAAGYADVKTGEISARRLWEDLRAAGFVRTKMFREPVLDAGNRDKFTLPNALPQPVKKPSDQDDEGSGGKQPSPVLRPIYPGLNQV